MVFGSEVSDTTPSRAARSRALDPTLAAGPTPDDPWSLDETDVDWMSADDADEWPPHFGAAGLGIP